MLPCSQSMTINAAVPNEPQRISTVPSPDARADVNNNTRETVVLINPYTTANPETTTGSTCCRVLGDVCFSCGVHGICCRVQRSLSFVIKRYLSYGNPSPFLCSPAFKRCQLYQNEIIEYYHFSLMEGSCQDKSSDGVVTLDDGESCHFKCAEGYFAPNGTNASKIPFACVFPNGHNEAFSELKTLIPCEGTMITTSFSTIDPFATRLNALRALPAFFL